MSCEWVSLLEYANRENVSIDIVEEQADSGMLGPVHTEEGCKYIIWPKNQQKSDTLPEFGKKSFKIIAKQNIDAMIEIDNTEQALTILGKYPNLEEAIERSCQQLIPSCLLLYWTVFEAYVKDFIETLYCIHPEQVLKKYGKNEMTLNAIFDGSHRFTDIESLKHKVLDEVLAKYDRENISKLIEFVGDCYLSKGTDPFTAQYVCKGEKHLTSRSQLDQIRIIRNALIHDNGVISEKEWRRIDLLPRDGENSVVNVSDDALNIVSFILKSIAYNLYQLTRKQYPESRE